MDPNTDFCVFSECLPGDFCLRSDGLKIVRCTSIARLTYSSPLDLITFTNLKQQCVHLAHILHTCRFEDLCDQAFLDQFVQLESRQQAIHIEWTNCHITHKELGSICDTDEYDTTLVATALEVGITILDVKKVVFCARPLGPTSESNNPFVIVRNLLPIYEYVDTYRFIQSAIKYNDSMYLKYVNMYISRLNQLEPIIWPTSLEVDNLLGV